MIPRAEGDRCKRRNSYANYVAMWSKECEGSEPLHRTLSLAVPLQPGQGVDDDRTASSSSEGVGTSFYQPPVSRAAIRLYWGHAVSKDLVHWTHLPAPLSRQTRYGEIMGGSAVVDWKDSSGFFGGKPGIVCAFTYADTKDGYYQSTRGSRTAGWMTPHFTTYAATRSSRR